MLVTFVELALSLAALEAVAAVLSVVPLEELFVSAVVPAVPDVVPAVVLCVVLLVVLCVVLSVAADDV
jgi:hypothetical protein